MDCYYYYDCYNNYCYFILIWAELILYSNSTMDFCIDNYDDRMAFIGVWVVHIRHCFIFMEHYYYSLYLVDMLEDYNYFGMKVKLF